MKKGLFSKESISPRHQKWRQCIKRELPIYLRDSDIRSHFSRDYNRILHCTAYRRLKHKTQVFFATTNDHICTRMEHVNHVTSVSYTISKYLGLNTELTNAIAVGHDLGHTPFGHAGESFLSEIADRELGETFWHEMNSLKFSDKIETLEDPNGVHQNLDLTYAVRDGIVCHCGEVDENAIFPRESPVVLERIKKPSKHMPFTWEGCVVKVADKIAYLGRDIEDAITLKILEVSDAKKLINIVRPYSDARVKELNNTVLIHDLIIDLCENSSPSKGIRISDETLDVMDSLKKYNYDNIYHHKRLNSYRHYVKLIIDSIFATLKDFYKGQKTLNELKRYERLYPTLIEVFSDWLIKYGYPKTRNEYKFKNKILYDMRKEKDFSRAIIDFISGMTDTFAIRIFNEITTF